MNDEVKNPAVPRSWFKLPRFLFSLLAAISMLLCVATAVLWVRSYSVADSLVKCWYGDNFAMTWGTFLESDSGAIAAYHVDTDRPKSLWKYEHVALHWYFSRRQSFGYASSLDYMKKEIVAVKFPHWCAAALFGMLPAVWIIQRSRKSVPLGHCQQCGYDLRATPERCPECGLEPKG